MSSHLFGVSGDQTGQASISSSEPQNHLRYDPYANGTLIENPFLPSEDNLPNKVAGEEKTKEIEKASQDQRAESPLDLDDLAEVGRYLDGDNTLCEERVSGIHDNMHRQDVRLLPIVASQVRGNGIKLGQIQDNNVKLGQMAEQLEALHRSTTMFMNNADPQIQNNYTKLEYVAEQLDKLQQDTSDYLNHIDPHIKDHSIKLNQVTEQLKTFDKFQRETSVFINQVNQQILSLKFNMQKSIEVIMTLQGSVNHGRTDIVQLQGQTTATGSKPIPENPFGADKSMDERMARIEHDVQRANKGVDNVTYYLQKMVSNIQQAQAQAQAQVQNTRKPSQPALGTYHKTTTLSKGDASAYSSDGALAADVAKGQLSQFPAPQAPPVTDAATVSGHPITTSSGNDAPPKQVSNTPLAPKVGQAEARPYASTPATKLFGSDAPVANMMASAGTPAVEPKARTSGRKRTSTVAFNGMAETPAVKGGRKKK